MSGIDTGALERRIPTPRPEWLSKREEEILEPELEIIDPHHHLWDMSGRRYLIDELLGDLGSGHRIVATVFLECAAMYRAGGPERLRPVGEVEFVNGIAAMSASGRYGPTRICEGIVGFADLTLGGAVEEVLAALVAAGNGRFRGTRYGAGHDPSPDINNSHTNPPPGIYADPVFREGFAKLADFDLSFEAWLYHPQLDDIAGLADAFPGQRMVLNHCGGPLGIGPYAGRREDILAGWQASMRELARRSNVHVKLGGLGMIINGYRFEDRAIPPGSEELADAWRPWFETLIEAFGVERCMFESNFPVDKVTAGYAIYWNAFKRISAGASAEEKRALFHDTAARFYRIGNEAGPLGGST